MEERHAISLGAGVQSSTMLLMAIHGEITPKPEIAVFADTGWEPKHVYDWLEWPTGVSESAGIPVVRIAKGNIKSDILEQAGRDERTHRFANPPFYVRNSAGKTGKLFRYCTKEYKIEPITKAIRTHLGLQPRARAKGRFLIKQWRGISTDEIIRAKSSKADDWIQVRYPLIEANMTRDDCLTWMSAHGYPVPPKSSCIGCPYHSNAYWFAMKKYTPGDFNEAVEFDKAIRRLPTVNGEVYLHSSLKPLDEVDLGAPGTPDIFGEECEGMCGL